MGFVGVGDEPAYARRWVVAGAGFAEGHFVATYIEAALAGAVEDRSEHAFADFRELRGDIQIALDARGKVLNIVGGARVLQVVQSAAVGERGREGNQLQRRDLNSFAKTGHARDAAVDRRRHRERTGMLFRQVIAGQLTEAQETRILRYRVKTHADAELFKEDVVGMGHGFGKVHVLAMADLEHGVASDYVFFESGEGDGRLDGGARNVAVAESDFLIDDGKDAAGVGIDGHDGAVVAAQTFHRSLANNGIVKSTDVGKSGVCKCWNAAEAQQFWFAHRALSDR